MKIKNKIVLAPMAGITNSAFRTIASEMGAGLTYTEMISIMGITHNSKKTIDLLKIKNCERPISIQIFGSDINSFVEAAKYIEKNIKPDIIDINMGCPVPKVAIKSQAGSALLKDLDKIYEIIAIIKKNISTPITVKIRSGWDDKHINAIEVAKACEKAGASAICIHPRTRAQGYSGKSDWKLIKQIKENVSIPVIGNGDIKNKDDAKKMIDQTNCDAVMIGRATLGNPWLIKECVNYLENKDTKKITIQDKKKMILKHYKLLKKETNEKSALLQMRSHTLWYLKGIPNNKEIKSKIMSIKNEKEFIETINNFI